MPTLSPKVTPYYGGGQAVNPANVTQVTSAPTTTFTQDALGSIQVNYSTGAAYMLVKKADSQNTWINLGGGSGSFTSLTVTGTSAFTGGSFTVSTGTNPINIGSDPLATTINIAAGLGAKTLILGSTLSTSSSNLRAGSGGIGLTATNGAISLTSGTGTITIGANGSQFNLLMGSTTGTSATTIRSGSGGITLTGNTSLTGNLSLASAGNKLSVATGTNATVGTSSAMTAGSVTVSNTSVTANSFIFCYPASLGTVTSAQSYYISAIVAGTSFTITSSDATDTSTWNYWIIN